MSDGPELIMPFVAVTSRGGHHDDRSFVAGFQMGHLYWQLQTAVAPFEGTFYESVLGQADVIAMRWGWRMTVTDRYDEWRVARFEREVAS